MISIQRCPVYNSLILEMSTLSSPLLQGFSLLLVFFFLLPAPGFAADRTTAEQELARKIAAVTGPGAVALDIMNRSSLGNKEVDEIAGGLRSGLESLGLRAVKPEQAAATIQVTLSENLQNYVWVAEIQQGAGEFSVVMVSTPRVGEGTFLREPAPLLVRKVPLWEQQQRILDVAVLEEASAPSHIAVLDPDKVVVYRLVEGRWQAEQELAIAHARPWPRDLRGRLVPRQDHLFDAYLPGVFCQSSGHPPLSLSCHESDDPWPLGGSSTLNAFFAPTRNFFTGVLAPGVGNQNLVAKFYSAAAVPRPSYTFWLFAAVDGQVHLLDGITDQTARWNWGSDIVGLKSSCGSGWQVMATRAGNGSGDSIRAYEFPDRDPVPVSQAVDFTGPITALWSEAKGTSAVVVSHNAVMGNYEAFRLSITCGQ
jgi:hypothetical protein